METLSKLSYFHAGTSSQIDTKYNNLGSTLSDWEMGQIVQVLCFVIFLQIVLFPLKLISSF